MARMCGVNWCLLEATATSDRCRFHGLTGLTLDELNLASPSRALIARDARRLERLIASDAHWNAQFEDGDGVRSA